MNATELHKLGFTQLVSVIPPKAKLAPNSSISPDSRGKSPGVKYPSGWGGYNWRAVDTSLENAMRIDESGANIGLAAERFPAIDVDVLEPALADAICSVIEEILETGPVRVGLPPKRLYVFRLPEGEKPFTRMQLVLEYNGRQLIEILGAGQQYVIGGMHAKTSKPYKWLVPLVPAAELPVLTRDLADMVLTAIESLVCDMFGFEYHRAGHGARSAPEHQEELIAFDIEELAAAVKVIPNSSERFPTRADYIRMGYAVKAATQSDPSRGFDIFSQWALDWPENTLETVQRDWDSLTGPYEIGASYVFELAREYGLNTAAADFRGTAEEPPPFKEKTPAADTRHSDMWMVDLLVKQYGREIAFQPERGKWLSYEGGIWNEDLSAKVPEYARQICVDEGNKMLSHGATDQEKKAAVQLAKSLSSSRQLDSIIKLGKQDSRIIVRQDKFDVSPVLLGTPNGIVNLDTGETFPSTPEMYISKSTAVAQGGTPERWYEFLEEATDGDVELQKYLQRLAGYCLTGYTIENILFFVWGEGGRGKSTFVDTISSMLGSYAKVAQMSTFTAKKVEGHPTEIAALAGARLVTAQETNDGTYWNEARIKALTGGDAVTARFMHQDDFTYVPAFKLLFSGNSRPKMNNADFAMKRRIHLIPFNHQPKTVDLRLKEKLKAELGGILTWAIEGALEWKRLGLAPPTVITEATNDYLNNESAETRWLHANTVPEGKASATELYNDWNNWCDKTGESPTTHRKFIDWLINRGTKRVVNDDGSVSFAGLSLKSKQAAVPGSEFTTEERQVLQ